MAPPKPLVKAPKRPRFEMLSANLRPAFHAEEDAEVKAAQAAVLAQVHRGLHAIFKPDELARAAATRTYRRKHPAADAAARARARGKGVI